MIAWLLQHLALMATVGGVVMVTYSYALPIEVALRKRLAREVALYQQLSEKLLRRPTEREVQWIFGILFGLSSLGWLLAGFWTKILLAVPLFWLGWRLPSLWLKFQMRQRFKLFQDQLVDVLTLISNALKSGLSLMQAFGMVATEMPEPAGEEFQHLLTQQQVGQTLEAGFAEMLERLPSDDFKLVVQSVMTLRETGGNLASTFDTMTEMMRERLKVHGKIRSMTAQGLVQSAVISAMPIGLLLVFSFIAPEFVRPLIHTHLGWACLGLVLMLQLIGGLVMKKIITIKV